MPRELDRCTPLAIAQECKERLKHLEYEIPVSAASLAILRSVTNDPWRKYLRSHYEPDALFIHVPKAAGTSILRMFGFQVGHVPITRYYAWDKSRARSAFKFAFVRDPWDRLRSGYFFSIFQHENLTQQRKLPNAERYRVRWVEEHVLRFGSFENFVLRLKNKKFRRSILSYYVFRPQLDWISFPGSSGHEMNYIGRVESIFDDIEFLRSLFGITKPFIAHRITPAYDAAFSSEMLDVVSDVYNSDIARLGY